MSKTLCSRRRRLYAAFCRGAPFKAEILRRGWTSCAVAPREGMERGHYVDIEVVAAAALEIDLGGNVGLALEDFLEKL